MSNAEESIKDDVMSVLKPAGEAVTEVILPKNDKSSVEQVDRKATLYSLPSNPIANKNFKHKFIKNRVDFMHLDRSRGGPSQAALNI